MKLRTIWCYLSNKKYKSHQGYVFRGGLFATYKDHEAIFYEGATGWINHHIPTGLMTFRNSKSFKEARAGARRMMTTMDCIDWYETDGDILGPEIQSIKPCLEKYFFGEITKEQFYVEAMKEKLNGN